MYVERRPDATLYSAATDTLTVAGATVLDLDGANSTTGAGAVGGDLSATGADLTVHGAGADTPTTAGATVIDGATSTTSLMSLPMMKAPACGAGAASPSRARVPAQNIPPSRARRGPPPGLFSPPGARMWSGGSGGAKPSSTHSGGLDGPRRKSGGGGPTLVGKLRLAITCPNCALAIDRV
jgi:hypothetical protein